MSTLGKIFLGIALAGALASGVLGFLLISQYNATKANLVQTQSDKAAADKEAAKQKAAALSSAQAAADASAALATSKSDMEKLNGQLTDAKTAAQAATDALAQAKADADKAKTALDDINKQLDGHTVDEFKAAKAKAETDLATAESEKKIMEDAVDAYKKKVVELSDAINRKDKGTILPGVSGKVTFVNRTWNFVVLNVGLSNGVVPNGELIVYRNNSFLGKVKVTSVDANSCVADILPDVKGDIQIGDYVLN